MTLAPLNQALAQPAEKERLAKPDEQGRLTASDLEILADKLIDMIKRELQVDNDREGRQS
jgi:hypothetical protein